MDKNNRPWLLESNANPSLTVTHEAEKGSLKPRESIVISEIDLLLKKPVLKEALLLSCVKPSKAKTI